MQKKNKFCTQMLAWMLTLSMILSLALPATSMNVQAETVSGPNLEETDNTVSGPNVTEKDNIISTAELNDESPILLNEPAEFLVELDFDSENISATPTGWSVHSTSIGNAEQMSMTVEADGTENKIVKVEQVSAVTNTTKDNYMYYSFEEMDKATLQYRFKFDASNNIVYLPTFMYNNDGNVYVPFYLQMRRSSGNVWIRYGENNTVVGDAALDLAANTWHTIKIKIDLTNNICELYINGNQIILDEKLATNYPCKADYKLCGVSTGFYRTAANCTFYIDDLNISEYVKEQPEQPTGAKIPFELDFNDETVNSIPSDWNVHSMSTGNTVPMSMTVEADGENNKVVAVKQETSRTSGADNYMYYSFEETDKATLQYRFKFDASNNIVYLPTFMYNNGGNVYAPLYLQMRKATENVYIRYGENNAVVGDVAELAANTWHTIKIKIDLTNNIRELYINGKQIILDEKLATNYPCKDNYKLCGVSTGFFRTAANCTFYIDDLAVSEYTPTIISEQNFDASNAGEVPAGWNVHSMSTDNTEQMSMTVEVDGTENKIVKVEQVSAVTNTTKDNYMYYSFEEMDKATLQYRFKFDASNNIVYLPTFMYNNDGNVYAPLYLQMRRSSGNVYIRYGENNTVVGDAALDLAANTWHTIKIKIDLTNNIRELYINGKQISLDEKLATNYPCKDNYKLCGVSTGFFRTAANCTFYIDDLKITEYLESDGNGEVEETVISSIPFSLTFEGENAEKELEGFTLNPLCNAEKTSLTWTLVEDPNSANNQVVKVNQTTLPEDNVDSYIRYMFEKTDEAVFEYRFKGDDSSNLVFLPIMMYDNGSRASGPLHLLLTSRGTKLRYSVNNSTWIDAITDLKQDEWHTIKMVVDISENIRELYVDGEQIILDENHMALLETRKGNKLCGVTGGIFKTSDNCTFYMDDISVSTYVAGESVTFESSEYTIPVNGTVTLTPQFTPTNTSAKGMTYVSSDASVATVDEKGVVTGLKEGEVKITATPAFNATKAVEVKVEVEGALAGEKSQLLLKIFQFR